MTAIAPSARKNPWLALIVLCIANFLILLDTTIVNAAVPVIMKSLDTGIGSALWILNAYLLAFATLLIVFGRLGDVVGPRRMFVVGLAVFAIASLGCALSQNSPELIGARTVQGIGAAMLAPQALVLITVIFPPERRGAALGIFVSVAGLAAISGPTLGGFLITDLGWQSIFYLNLPVCLIGIVLTYLFVPNLRLGRVHSFDIVGVVLATVGLVGLVYGLIESQNYGWGAASLIIVGAVIVLVAFVLWERRHPEPLVPLTLFRTRNFSIATAVTLITNFALYGLVLIFVIETQSVLGMSPLMGGVAVLPMSITLAILAPIGGRIADRVGGRTMLVIGLALFAIGTLGVAFLPTPASTANVYLFPLIVIGIGMGMSLAPSVSEALRVVAPQQAGAASGVLNTARQVGGALGAAVIGSILESTLISSIHDQAVSRSAQLDAPDRQTFLTDFAHATQGLQLGPAQSAGYTPPGGVSANAAAEMTRIAHESFGYGFVDAAKPTLGVVAGLMLIGAALAAFMKGHKPQPAQAPAPAKSEADATSKT
jgi:EmrB/QacA subfamily drug resistance transporter